MKTIKTILTAGLIGGYVTTVMQLTPGFNYTFRNLRRKVSAWSMKGEKDSARESIETLCYCGWCLSPWVTLPFAMVCTNLFRVRKGEKLVSVLGACSLAAFVRHTAESNPDGRGLFSGFLK